jgi:hypothetical protein
MGRKRGFTRLSTPTEVVDIICRFKNITRLTPDQRLTFSQFITRCDCILLTPTYTLAFELKATDLHESLMGKGVDGKLARELSEVYLPLTTLGYFDETLVFVAGIPPEFDLLLLDSMMCHYGIRKKTFLSQTSAVKEIFDFFQRWQTPIELGAPVYLNQTHLPTTLSRMLTGFNGISGEMAVKIEQFCGSLDGIADAIQKKDPHLRAIMGDALFVAFHDFWYNVVFDPVIQKQSFLDASHKVKKTKRIHKKSV